MRRALVWIASWWVPGCVYWIGEDEKQARPDDSAPIIGEGEGEDSGGETDQHSDSGSDSDSPGDSDSDSDSEVDTGPVDADGDGYNSDMDCDDGDPSRYPGAPELCDDRVVNDCDGDAEAAWADCAMEDRGADEADAVILGPGLYCTTGIDATAAGDVDGDGLGDVIIGTSSWTCDPFPGGAATVLTGPVSGELTIGEDGVTYAGVAASDRAGYAVAGVGDTDGDGLDDVAIGAYAAEGYAGVAYVVLGPAAEGGDLDGADGYAVGEVASSYLGMDVGPAGDMDGDGLADVLFGAAGDPEAVYLVHGPVERDARLDDAPTLTSPEDNKEFGRALAADDWTGDGTPDVVVGEQGYSASGSSDGRAYLFEGPVDADEDGADARAVLTSDDAGASFGGSVATAGDTDGDGVADLLVGAYYGEDTGVATVWLGPVLGSHGSDEADATFVGEEPLDFAGSGVGTAGDMDGDGLADLLVGAHSAGRDGEGVAYLVRGPVAGTHGLDEASVRFTGEADGDLFGRAPNGAGDTNGDGFPDLIVGAQEADTTDDDAGNAYLFRGGGY